MLETIFIFAIFAIVIGLYFLPSILAVNKRNKIAIFALNLLLGWSLIGWAIALIWALCKDAQGTPPAPFSPSLLNNCIANPGSQTEVAELMKEISAQLAAQGAQRSAQLASKWVWF
jgi:hypothetical protein